MTVSAPLLGVTEEEWLGAPAELGEAFEVVGGELVAQKIGGNPHHCVARRIAETFERQWPGVTATAPGVWALDRSARTAGSWSAGSRTCWLTATTC